MAILLMNDLRAGKAILYKDQPHVVLSYVHGGTGRGSGNVKTVLRNLLTGAQIPVTYGPADKIDEADVENGSCQFLYEADGDYFFMADETFEQFSFDAEALGDSRLYLTAGLKCVALYFNSQPVSVTLPVSVDLKIVETVPGVKGDTASGGSKPATLETGAVVQVPLFIKEGEIVKVNTQTGEYQSRA